MKKYIVLILALVMVLCMCSCTKKVEVPNVKDVDENTAKTTLTNKGLIPEVKYEYSNLAAKGKVIRTDPAIGEKVDEDSRIVIYVSKGRSHIDSKSSTINWYDVDWNNSDKWEFYAPYIEKDILYIQCDVTFGTTIKFETNVQGMATTSSKSFSLSLVDSTSLKLFSKPVTANSGVHTKFTISIPIEGSNTSELNHIDCKWFYKQGGQEKQLNCSFDIVW